MNQDEAKGKVATAAAIFLILIVAALYLFPWLLPLFYDMPEGTTLPYYALLLAIEMSPHTGVFKEDMRNDTDSE